MFEGSFTGPFLFPNRFHWDLPKSRGLSGYIAQLFPCFYFIYYSLSLMAHKVVLIPGDGIGPEITEAALDVLAATGDRKSVV